jgi:transposase InsO family protein
VLDCFSRRVVGWAMAEHMRAEFVVEALEVAVVRRQPDAGVVHHSDQGSQYVSHVFGQRCRQAGIDISMGAKGSALDNAVCESFFGSLKKELIRQRCWPGGASRGVRSSSGSRPGTTRAGCTRRSGTSHRTTTAIALGPGGDGGGS